MFIGRLWYSGVLAILRGFSEEDAFSASQALIEAGISTIEITADSRGAWRVIESLKASDPRLIVGAGTVLDSETAKEAIQAGADFLFSPIVNRKMIELAHRYGRLAIPGAMTPTEVVTALEAGADIVKLFPAGSLGVNYLKELRGPFPYVPFLPTGGITTENAAAFIKAGAIGVGMGSALVKKEWVKQKDFTKLAAFASELQKQISVQALV